MPGSAHPKDDPRSDTSKLFIKNKQQQKAILALK